MRRWWEDLSKLLWQMRNARFQQRRAMDAKRDERSAEYLDRTKHGAGDPPRAHL